MMKSNSKKKTILLLLSLLYLQAYSQSLRSRIEYELISDSTIRLTAIYNLDKEAFVNINIDGGTNDRITAGGSLSYNKICYRFVRAQYLDKSIDLWRKEDAKKEWDKKHPQKTSEKEMKGIPSDKPQANNQVNIKEKKQTETETETEAKPAPSPTPVRSKVTDTQIDSHFQEVLEKDSFYSSSFIRQLFDELAKHSQTINSMTDKESKETYIHEHQLMEYLNEKEALITSHENQIDSLIRRFLASEYKADDLPADPQYETQLRNILEQKIAERKDVLDKFRTDILAVELPSAVSLDFFNGTSMVNNVLLGIGVVGLLILVVILMAKRNRKKKPTIVPGDNTKQDSSSDIVVKRKTTSILKKQSLEDVQQNEAYLSIDCSEFCSDSAVKRIYLKNTCIKDIYNLYAEDLRNPENPKEDGCMVLGRWIHDEGRDEYLVSLEEIVRPGDDAVFKEYELNFGGKIKLKVSEKLRRLRKDSDLQYDMTCWVHSHPGLGVFFSNADSNVQMQLKHPTHPKFLVAIVIDILTPEQELGIFTFKHDMSINSKADLLKMYSLEELYKWAVMSDRNSFKKEDYRNIMQTATKRIDTHYDVELSNGAIIDMCQLQANQENGLLAWVYGYSCEQHGKIKHVLKSVSQSKQLPDNERIGCFINGAHCSIPTIKRLISNNFSSLKFILFYSTSSDVLTSIPVIDGQISMDETCFGEEKLEDLKIWTRRKR